MTDISSQVTLRPVDEDDLSFLQDMLDNPEEIGEFEWTGWHDRHQLRRDWDRNGLRGEDVGILIVTDGDKRLGIVSFRRKNGATAYHWEIGIALLPAARGHGYGAEAQRQLVRYLFTHTPANRVEAWTESGNIAEQRSLERAGFSREGVRRGVGWRGGAWRDAVLYGILRAEAGPLAR
jgi:RimJ/RimL family protein N-acetyltransferase